MYCKNCGMKLENVEIKKQTQIFVTVSYYFRMQV